MKNLCQSFWMRWIAVLFVINTAVAGFSGVLLLASTQDTSNPSGKTVSGEDTGQTAENNRIKRWLGAWQATEIKLEFPEEIRKYQKGLEEQQRAYLKETRYLIFKKDDHLYLFSIAARIPSSVPPQYLGAHSPGKFFPELQEIPSEKTIRTEIPSKPPITQTVTYRLSVAEGGDELVFEYAVSVSGALGEGVIAALNSIFATELEGNSFLHPPRSFGAIKADNHDDYKAGSLRARVIDLVHNLDRIISNNLSRYTDLPLQLRLYVEDIDSFRKVRDVNPSMVAGLLPDGRLELPEDVVQVALEQILDVPMHKKDWGGEMNDLYTANVTVNGARTATAFLLKGNGLKKKVMEIADCGKNGDQLVRLFQSPAQLFIVQFVGEISETLIKDAEGKVVALRSTGKLASFCIMNGQDTARLLYAYGKPSA